MITLAFLSPLLAGSIPQVETVSIGFAPQPAVYYTTDTAQVSGLMNGSFRVVTKHEIKSTAVDKVTGRSTMISTTGKAGDTLFAAFLKDLKAELKPGEPWTEDARGNAASSSPTSITRSFNFPAQMTSGQTWRGTVQRGKVTAPVDYRFMETEVVAGRRTAKIEYVYVLNYSARKGVETIDARSGIDWVDLETGLSWKEVFDGTLAHNNRSMDLVCTSITTVKKPR